MRRSAMASEVGMNLTPGFGAMQELKRQHLRLRLGEPYKIAGYCIVAVLAVAVLGHLH